MTDLRTATALDGNSPFATESQIEASFTNWLLFAAFDLPPAAGTAA